jgi:WD40 repeat protein
LIARRSDVVSFEYGTLDIAEPQGASGFMGIAFSKDGSLFVRTIDRASGPNVIVHSTPNWEQLWNISTRPFSPRTLALSPKGRLAAVAGTSSVFGPGPSGLPIVLHSQILIIDLQERKVIRTVAAFPDNTDIQTLSWSADGTSLAAGAIVDNSKRGVDAVRIFDPMTGGQLSAEVASDAAFVSGLRYSRDGHYLIEVYIDGTVRIWDARHRHLLQSIPVDEHFHSAISTSPDSRHLAIAAGRDVSVWELK